MRGGASPFPCDRLSVGFSMYPPSNNTCELPVSRTPQQRNVSPRRHGGHGDSSMRKSRSDCFLAAWRLGGSRSTAKTPRNDSRGFAAREPPCPPCLRRYPYFCRNHSLLSHSLGVDLGLGLRELVTERHELLPPRPVD